MSSTAVRTRVTGAQTHGSPHGLEPRSGRAHGPQCRRRHRLLRAAALAGRTRVEHIATPGDCIDGFFEAFWRRPEALLDPAIRSAQSMWALLDPGVEERIVARLSAALESGAWDAEHGHLREQTTFRGALRLVISAAR